MIQTCPYILLSLPEETWEFPCYRLLSGALGEERNFPPSLSILHKGIWDEAHKLGFENWFVINASLQSKLSLSRCTQATTNCSVSQALTYFCFRGHQTAVHSTHRALTATLLCPDESNRQLLKKPSPTACLPFENYSIFVVRLNSSGWGSTGL